MTNEDYWREMVRWEKQRRLYRRAQRKEWNG
jgi:hypothetical protein